MNLISEAHRVIVIKPRLKDWESGVIITCKRCGKMEVVKKGSLCDSWQLCSDCAREDIKTGRLKAKPPSSLIKAGEVSLI